MKQLSIFLLSLFCFSVPVSASAQGLVSPVSGGWIALQGPPCPAPGNHHCSTPNQQFAYDLVPLSPAGTPTSCIGMPIRSPANGVVTAVHNAYPNNPPGVPSMAGPGVHPAGNHIVIQSAAGYILLGHLTPGSMTVSVGTSVSAGQVVAQCGHNGNSSFPHLHVHMQTHPDPANFASPGIPMTFSNISLSYPPGSPCTNYPSWIPGKGVVFC
jgi:hypothetical protein